MDIIASLLGDLPVAAVSVASPRACLDMLDALDASLESLGARQSSIDRAVAGGFRADRLGYAFLAGYRAALLTLDASLTRASLCATEEGGAHPRAIETRLVPFESAYRLDGNKTFATLASVADTLLVVASFDRDGGLRPPSPREASPRIAALRSAILGRHANRNHLRVVRIPSGRKGIVIRDRPPLPFAPEIPHAEVTFHDVHVEPAEVLDGDGYAGVLKLFRTIEDIHVTAGWLAYIVRLARESAARDIVERAIASIAALRELSGRDPSASDTHVALAGVLAHATGLVEDWNLDGCDEEARQRWRRDRPLLEVARTVRNLRREAAWAQIEDPPQAGRSEGH